MSTAIIDINDIGLRCFHEKKQVITPGYALLTSDGVITGEAALRRSYLEPQQSFNQFWRQLSLSPLATTSRFARHHADLAYAQLLQLHAEGGAPEDVVFAVPGSFTDDQLGILLGLGNALPFNVVGLVDAAVADCLNVQQSDFVHVDVQLHQTVLTRIETGKESRRVSVDVLPDLGLKAYYDTWAHHIADQYIQQYRYDPLHTAAGEQQLHDKLPHWIAQLQAHGELPIELDTTQGALRLSLARADILKACQKQQQRLLSSLEKLGGGRQIVYSHRIRQLLGFGLSGGGPEAWILDEADLPSNCLANLDFICSKDSEMSFVTQLPVGERTEASASRGEIAGQGVASHVLVEGIALPIGGRLVLAVTPQGLQPAVEGDENTHNLVIFKENDAVALRTGRQDLDTQARLNDLQPGDRVAVGDFQLLLIEVR